MGESNLSGACIRFPREAGSWTVAEAAAGIEIPYEVIIEADIAKVVPRARDAGDCGSIGPSGLDVFERLGNDAHSYCVCDMGLCAPDGLGPRTIPAGETPMRFVWEGVEWAGPSDTNNPFGPPFPPGVYTLEVSAAGTVKGEPFEVRNSFEVTLTP